MFINFLNILNKIWLMGVNFISILLFLEMDFFDVVILVWIVIFWWGIGEGEVFRVYRIWNLKLKWIYLFEWVLLE